MQLAVRPEDAETLLKTRNVLDLAVQDKYREAGRIVLAGMQLAATLINERYHQSSASPLLLAQELCVRCDSLLAQLSLQVFKAEVREKGIASPTQVNVNDLAYGFAPEIDDVGDYTFVAGDIVTVLMGVHIDGYTANAAHTFVIYPAAVERGPLLGSKADAICAAQIAIETVLGLLGLAMLPEKVPQVIQGDSGVARVTGGQIRTLVDAIAASFNCVVAPGLKVRRIRRFLAGQAEGMVAERDFKGVVWDELHQELLLLRRSSGYTAAAPTRSGDDAQCVPSDDFQVFPGEVYLLDICMCGLADRDTLGVVTLKEIDAFLGKNHSAEFNARPTIYVRDYAVSHALRLEGARQLLKQVDVKFGVFAFKLTHATPAFPLVGDEYSAASAAEMRSQVRKKRLGLSELSNRHLVRTRPIQTTIFIPLEQLLLASNPTGRHGMDMGKPVLPGHEVPLPQMGVSLLKLRQMWKHGVEVSNAREQITVALLAETQTVLKVGKVFAEYVHSDYEVTGEYADAIKQIQSMLGDERFGIKVKQV